MPACSIKLYEVFVCAHAAGSRSYTWISVSIMQFANCAAFAAVLFTTFNSNICF